MPGVDLINRDPNQMNHYVQANFDDVLAEPEDVHSIDCVWSTSVGCFNCGKNCCYKLMTFFCGICIALGWGWTFAMIAFMNIWFKTPCVRAMQILLHPVKILLSIYLSTFLGPCMQTLGLFLSRIHVTQSQGPPPRPLGSIDGDDKQGVSRSK